MPIGLRRARPPPPSPSAAGRRRGGASRSRGRSPSGREPAAAPRPPRPAAGPGPERPAPAAPGPRPSLPGPLPGRPGEGGDGGDRPTAAAMRPAPLLLGLLGALGGWAPAAGAPEPPPGPPCRAPLRWEGRQVGYEPGSGRLRRALLAYDGPGRRLRLLEERKAPIPCQRFFEYIFLYQDAVMFQIDQATKLCSKIALTDQWDPLDIPQNSTFEDQYYIGGPQDQILVQEWSDRKPARKYETWIGIYTVKDCYPVQETYTRNYSVTFSTRFFDIQLGIRDPSVFTPPDTCERAQTTKMSDAC